MVRTRVGYAGGVKPEPTYRSLGDHTETFEVDFDPSVLDYRDLLDVFWGSHDPSARPFSTQYKAIVLAADERQERLAEESAATLAERGVTVRTEIARLDRFWLAEGYHQKYYLQGERVLAREFRDMFDSVWAFTDSTAAAKVNGLVGGYGSPGELERLSGMLGLSEEALERLRRLTGLRGGRGCRI